jgi:hypothetical protein
MVNTEKDKPNNSNEKQVPSNVKLVPAFKKEQDINLGEVEQLKLTVDENSIVDSICPHYNILKSRYAEYKNPDPTGRSDGLMLQIDRRHELATFTAVLSQAALLSNIETEPTRIIKCFVYENGKQVPKLVYDTNVKGIRSDGSPTTIANIRVGYYRYPLQFQKDNDGEWSPINNRFEKNWYLDWNKEEVERLSNIGNPYTKKYCVWHPDGHDRKYYRKEHFLNMTDEEQIKDMEKPKDQQVR